MATPIRDSAPVPVHSGARRVRRCTCNPPTPSVTQGLGAVRFLAETLVTARWLGELTNDFERVRRARRTLLGSIERAGRLGRHARPDDVHAVEVIDQAKRMKDTLLEISKADGFAHLRFAADRKWLFDRYLGEIGYGMFALLSELGAHPGPLGILFFAMDPKSCVVDARFGGAFPDRAYWASIAYTMFAHICDELGRLRGWDSWLDNDVEALIDAASPFLAEAGERWEEHRGFQST